jgi:hypothetical protein
MGPKRYPRPPGAFVAVSRAHSVPVRYADRTGAVIREAIEGVSGDRTQIGGAARNPHRHRSHRVVAIVAMPVAVVRVVMVGVVAGTWILSGSRRVRSGFRPGRSRRRLIERRRGRGRCGRWRRRARRMRGRGHSWGRRRLSRCVRARHGKGGQRNERGHAQRDGRGSGNSIGHHDLLRLIGTGRGRPSCSRKHPRRANSSHNAWNQAEQIGPLCLPGSDPKWDGQTKSGGPKAARS